MKPALPSSHQPSSSTRRHAPESVRAGSVAVVAVVLVVLLGLGAVAFLFLAGPTSVSTVRVGGPVPKASGGSLELSLSAKCRAVSVAEDGRWSILVDVDTAEGGGAWDGFQASSGQAGYGPPYVAAELVESPASGSAIELPFTLEFSLGPFAAEAEPSTPPKLFFDATVHAGGQVTTTPIEVDLTELPE